jgi:TonB-dependent receptor
MFHLRYNVGGGFDMRFAITRSLARPDYFRLVPFENINDIEQTVSRGNPDLKHTTVWNYDLMLSYYNPIYGYLGVGLFYKSLTDVDYIRQTIIRDGGPLNSFFLTSPVNTPESTVRGIELDLQTDFKYLPKPFDGLILNTNITFIESETFFPEIVVGERSPDPPFRPVIIDTVRAGQIPGQPEMVASFTIGYEVAGFSARASLAFQKAISDEIGLIEELDNFDDGFSFWDLAINYKPPQLTGVTFFMNVNNFTAESDRSFINNRNFPTLLENFGYTADAGVRFKF